MKRYVKFQYIKYLYKHFILRADIYPCFNRWRHWGTSLDDFPKAAQTVTDRVVTQRKQIQTEQLE